MEENGTIAADEGKTSRRRKWRRRRRSKRKRA
jgi:hypothetical protein